jgi:hypothetical protein
LTADEPNHAVAQLMQSLARSVAFGMALVRLWSSRAEFLAEDINEQKQPGGGERNPCEMT